MLKIWLGMQSRDPEIPGSQTNCPTQSRPGLTSNPGILTALCFKLQFQLFQIQWVTLTFENGPVVQWSGATSFAILISVRRNAKTVVSIRNRRFLAINTHAADDQFHKGLGRIVGSEARSSLFVAIVSVQLAFCWTK